MPTSSIGWLDQFLAPDFIIVHVFRPISFAMISDLSELAKYYQEEEVEEGQVAHEEDCFSPLVCLSLSRFLVEHLAYAKSWFAQRERELASLPHWANESESGYFSRSPSSAPLWMEPHFIICCCCSETRASFWPLPPKDFMEMTASFPAITQPLVNYLLGETKRFKGSICIITLPSRLSRFLPS